MGAGAYVVQRQSTHLPPVGSLRKVRPERGGTDENCCGSDGGLRSPETTSREIPYFRSLSDLGGGQSRVWWCSGVLQWSGSK